MDDFIKTFGLIELIKRKERDMKPTEKYFQVSVYGWLSKSDILMIERLTESDTFDVFGKTNEGKNDWEVQMTTFLVSKR